MPKLLDLFCGAGGAAVGYNRAGFDDIVGIDIVPQPNYPFKFIQDDAIEYLLAHGHEFDFIHASPPCQAYSIATPEPFKKNHPRLIRPLREAIRPQNKIYVIENVIGCNILVATAILCGKMFGLDVIRHRIFECNTKLVVPKHLPHDGKVYTVTSHNRGFLRQWSKAMGIDWMTREEIAQAVPPAYTEYIGKQVIKCLR